MAFTDDLRHEAATLRVRLGELRLQRDALADAVDETTAAFNAAAAEVKTTERCPAHDEADARHRALSDYTLRLSRVTSEKADIEARLGSLDRLLQAPERVSAARLRVADCRGAVEAGAKALDAHAAGIARLTHLHAAAVAAAEQARAATAARAVAELPEDVRALLGASTQPTQHAGDPAAEEARARALADAIDRAERQDDTLRRNLDRARDALVDAERDLLADLAAVSELDHAQALAAYLPKLAAFRAAHEVAHGFAPELPEFRRIADTSRGEAMQAVRDAVHSVGEGVLKRAARRVAAALGA